MMELYSMILHLFSNCIQSPTVSDLKANSGQLESKSVVCILKTPVISRRLTTKKERVLTFYANELKFGIFVLCGSNINFER